MAFARWWYAMHGDKKASEASSKAGEKKAEVEEITSTSEAIGTRVLKKLLDAKI